jgi:iron(III) transport system permease protein
MSQSAVSTARAPQGAFAVSKAPGFFTGWRLVAVAIAALIALPLLVVASSLLHPDREVWTHLVENVLGELIRNTILLALGVGAASALLGTSLAWLTAVCDFPGRRFFSWALMLPLAVPAYVTGFVLVGLLDFTGPIQTALRAWFGPISLPPIRSGGGVVAAMALALYPYVYLLARNAFLSQGKRALEAGQSLGLDRTQGFLRIALPMARPWIAGGIALVMMETLADFGTVAVFNYDTFTTGIYKAWYSLFSLPAAAQLASLLVIIVFVVLVLEQRMRAGMRYTQAGRGGQARELIALNGWQRWLAFAYCTLVFAAAFAIPVGQLMLWASGVLEQDLDARYLGYLWHSLLLGTLTALLVAGCALLLAYARRRHPDAAMGLLVRFSTLGYALPGAVLAIGIYLPIAWFDNGYIALMRDVFGQQAGPLLGGTLLAMLSAYLVRFLAVAHEPLGAAMQRITPNMDEAARSFGLNPRQVLARVHLPMLRGGAFTAMLLVFVDVMKEMPITLMTRPFGWDTLATRIFEMTSEGEWERAALPAVALLLAGLIPVILLSRQTEK